MGFDIIKSTKTISSKYVRYLKTVFDIEDSEYKRLFEKEIGSIGSFSKGPYLDVVDSFVAGASIEDLIKEGILSREFRKLERIHPMTLHKHQEEAIRQLAAGNNLVVSTGTGSGKTESFLLPILDSLMREIEEYGKIEPGVRALLIYPMNALANDQIARLREVLENYPAITFGSYTGQTKERKRDAEAHYHTLHGSDAKILSNELLSREEMKAAPPHILVTNYSMLEYLMLRPQDNTFFQGAMSGHWKFIVLDEAHTYTGSTGIEVSMLLRRLKAYMPDNDIRFILTSATLGDKNANERVAEFAGDLCSSEFAAENVIRATRVKIAPAEKYSLTAEDYLELNEIIDSGHADDVVFEMIRSRLAVHQNAERYEQYLFDVLREDSTFWQVKQFLSSPKTVAEVCAYMGWSEKELSAFVNVASQAVQGRTKLFDARYHMFIRATDGVYVTLGKHKELSLTRKNTAYYGDEEYKFFEIVTCTQCHAVYLLGRIDKGGDGNTYLQQRSHAGGSGIQEAFLVGDVVHDDDEDNSLADEHMQADPYELCPHCGMIRRADLVHKTAHQCGHPEKDFINLIKVKQSERTGRVTKCIKCEGVNNAGILRAFFSGQEASTSVIGTALFEELPDTETKVESIPDVTEDDGFGFDASSTAITVKRAKQFLAFSDNRQAAAFFATYFGESYEEILYSSLLLKAMNNVDDTGKPMTRFVQEASNLFRQHQIHELGEQNPDYDNEAWKAMLRELINGYARNSLMGLGLMAIDVMDDSQFRPNSKYGMSADEVRLFCLVMLQSFFNENAIYHGRAFSEAERMFFTNNNAESVYRETNYASDSSHTKYIKSFVPKTTSNRRLDYLNRIIKAKVTHEGLDLGVQMDTDEYNEKLILFLKAIWKHFLTSDNTGILIQRPQNDGFQADVNKLSIVRPKRWYQCSKCKRLTPYNIAGVCPAYRCDGKLAPIDPEEHGKTNHYYHLYHELQPIPLRVMEHTAQLDHTRAYALQEKFKNKEIDVLSCSTTFEMGVDIGALETVFMRNMPPTPSNYVQRAGRAGRSKESAALALTFCNKSNHDFSFFANPVSMIAGRIEPPLFKPDNEKIAIRHLYSAAFSFFWREYPKYFGQTSYFFGEKEAGTGYEDFKAYLYQKPENLRQYLLRAFSPRMIEVLKIKDFGWLGWLFDEPKEMYPNLAVAYSQYREDVESLFREAELLHDQQAGTGMVFKRIHTYERENIITFLSRSNVLPKYGFPVDTVELSLRTQKEDAMEGIELSRDLSMAIAEYAPGCQVVAAGNLITSRFIRKASNKEWREYDYIECDNCKTMNIALHHKVRDNDVLTVCRQCGESLQSHKPKTFLIPEFGFASDGKITRPTLIKPERTYRSDAFVVDAGNEIYHAEFDTGKLHVSTTRRENGEIAILNNSDFYVCEWCGYAQGAFELGTAGYTPTVQHIHKNMRGFQCKQEALRRFSLGYKFKTDALVVRLRKKLSYEEAYTVLQAMVLGGCDVLNIDQREIAGCLVYARDVQGGTYDFVIYDTTPGGAGHVRRFADERTMTQVLQRAYQRVNTCDCGGEEADTCCYKCLRTYQNQKYHDTMKRCYVINALKDITF